MEDWKKRLERWEKEKKEREEEKARQEGEKLAAAKLAKRKRFKCHVCGEHSSGVPLIRSSIGKSGWMSSENLDLPGDLEECSVCHKWTCDKHLHHGVCIRCFSRLERRSWLDSLLNLLRGGD